VAEAAADAAPGILHGFAAALTSFVGRAGEMSEASALLRQHRLVTVTGPGGVGKTRLAAEVARRVADQFADGAWLVELASVQDPALVQAAVAAALGVRQAAGVSIVDSLTTALARRQLLLVLDNCEHVLAEVAQLCGAVLLAADDVRVLATSREQVGVGGEARFRLASLSLPGPGDQGDVSGSEAVTLFAERARRVEPRFVLNKESVPVVVRLVQRLDGMPLAIELAAARVEALGVAQLLDRLDDRFRLLAGVDRLAPARHGSLAAAVDWSYRLLAEPERLVFRRLSVFPGPFTLAAAEAIAGADAGMAVLHLVDCSLLSPPQVGPDGRARYLMLETLRAFGAERLTEEDEADAAAAALARHALEVAEQAAAGLETTTGELDAVRWLDAEDATVHQGLSWALEHDPAIGLALAVALAPWWALHARYAAGYQLLTAAAEHVTHGEQAWCTAQIWLGALAVSSGEAARLRHYTAARDALAGGPPSVLLVRALIGRAGCLPNLDRIPEGAEEARRALTLARGLGDPVGEARALHLLGLAAHYAGDTENSLKWLRQAQRIDPAAISGRVFRQSLSMLTVALIEVSALDEAKHTCVQGLALARQAGALRDQANSLSLMARIDLHAGRLPEAAADLREAFQLIARTGYGALLPDALDLCGHLCAQTHRHADAVTVWAAYAACLKNAGMQDLPLDVTWRQLPLRTARQTLGPERARAAEQRGAAMTHVTAAEYAALLATAQPQAGVASVLRLTPRERELITLVAQGCTDTQIAARLYISVRTVSSHLDRIRDKTSCRRRADLTRLALEAGLV
jgi:non-specific serine/threonine protein kinase